MSIQLNSSSFSSQPTSSLFWIFLTVIILHLLLLGMGTFWNLTPLQSKPRSKLVVQTVRLQPFQSNTIQKSIPIASAPTAPSPVLIPNPLKEQAKTEEISHSQPLKEEIPEPNVTIQKEEPSSVAPPPLPIKIENSSPTQTPKPQATPQKASKADIKKSAPVKRIVEPAKKTEKKETIKSKQAEEAEKKTKKEQAEKKRQQEIAAAQEAARKKEQALLSKAKENLAKMSETRHKISAPSINLETTELPKALGHLEVDALSIGENGSKSEWSIKEASYSDEVAYRLKMTLRLPDYGAVKIKLTLDRTGKVVKVETIQSASSKNKAYVESKIPTLLFPSFGQRFQGVSQNTFVISLQND